MEQRVPSEQEAKYINKAYGVNDIFARYLLNLFIILFLVIIVVLFCASLNQTDAAAQAFSKAGGMLGIVSIGLIFVLIKNTNTIHNKRAVKNRKYVVIEGIAEKYMPYKVSESGTGVQDGERYSGSYSSVADGKIVFVSNSGEKELKQIPLKYKSCPKGKNLAGFPVLLIKLPNNFKFAVTDWNKIKNNPEYANIKPFVII